jgi:hypothetical protein
MTKNLARPDERREKRSKFAAPPAALCPALFQ